MEAKSTPFSVIYNSFLSKITDDMYMEFTKEDTYKLLKELLLSAIHKFEFPRFDITDYAFYTEKTTTMPSIDGKNYETVVKVEDEGHFNCELTPEEVNIIATYMIVEWLGQQLATVENVRMKYSGSDFKFTSQANHMAKILSLKKDYEREGFHLQRLYKRREKDKEGIMRSTMGKIMEKNAEGRNSSYDIR